MQACSRPTILPLSTRSSRLASFCFAMVLGAAAANAQASYAVSIVQNGSDVIATGSGSINLAAFNPPNTAFDSGGDDGAVEGDDAGIEFHILAQTPPNFDYYGIAGPTTFGSGDYIVADSTTGATIALLPSHNGHDLILAKTYVSGAPLGVSTDVFRNTTIDGLGLTPGFYEWTWGSGATADFFSIQIGSAASPPSNMPEPASFALFGVGFIGFVVARGRRTA